MSAVEKLVGLAAKHRQLGNKYVAEKLDQSATKGEEYAAKYLAMVQAVGRAARSIREKGTKDIYQDVG